MDYPRLLFVAAALTATALGAKHPDDLAPDDPCVVKLGTDAAVSAWTPTPAQTSCETLKFMPESGSKGLGEAGANKLGPLLARNHKLAVTLMQAAGGAFQPSAEPEVLQESIADAEAENTRLLGIIDELGQEQPQYAPQLSLLAQSISQR